MTETELYQELFSYFVQNQDLNKYTCLDLCYCYLYGVFSPVHKIKAKRLLKKYNLTVEDCETKNQWLRNLMRRKHGPIRHNVVEYALAFGKNALLGKDGFDVCPELADYCLSTAVRAGAKLTSKLVNLWSKQATSNLPMLYLAAVQKNGIGVCGKRILNVLKKNCIDGHSEEAIYVAKLMFYHGAMLECTTWLKQALAGQDKIIVMKKVSSFCYEMGDYYSEHHNIEKALLWYEKIFFEDNSYRIRKCNRLFEICDQFNSMRPDRPILYIRDKLGLKELQYLNKKLEWWEEAAANGSIFAYNEIALAFYLGTLAKQNDKKAIEYFYTAFVICNREHIPEYIVKAYWSQNIYVKKILAWFRKLAAKGVKEAQYCMANVYKYGLVSRKEFMPEMYWYCRAARSGDINARHVLEE